MFTPVASLGPLLVTFIVNVTSPLTGMVSTSAVFTTVRLTTGLTVTFDVLFLTVSSSLQLT